MTGKHKTYLATLTVVGLLAALVVGVVHASSGSNSGTGNPAWYGGGHRLDESGYLAAKVESGAASQYPASQYAGPSNAGSTCTAEPSATGNVQVNCLAEDGTSPQNTQSETSVSAAGSMVVVGYNDSLVCCTPALNFTGYSVSTDGGKTFTDNGDLPWQPNAQPIGDPAVAHDAQGNFYFASLALGSDGIGAHSLISFYKMAAGSSTFQLVSVPVDVGSGRLYFADKDYLAVGRDASGQTHFYITWTYFSSNPQSPIMLTDSTDGVNWRTTTVSSATACAQGSNPVPAGGTVYVSWEESIPAGCTDYTVTAAYAKMATFDVASGAVTGITTIASINGSGDKIVACNNAADLREVIETAPGHDARNFEMPTTTIDANGTLYAAWNDRPSGVGGTNANATRIFLSYSTDGNQTWSAPQQISGQASHTLMNDRFQPWITTDASGLHAMWYERVASSSGGADVLQADKEDLSLATTTSAPSSTHGETQISSVTFPIPQTNPQQDPVISYCYMGDYENITSNGTTRFVTWGDNRNVVTTSAGTTENQPDVFLASY